MKRFLVLVIVAVFGLMGCASTDKVRSSTSYREGYRAGCKSGQWYDLSQIKEYNKARARTDRAYFYGWEEGFTECRYNIYTDNHKNYRYNRQIIEEQPKAKLVPKKYTGYKRNGKKECTITMKKKKEYSTYHSEPQKKPKKVKEKKKKVKEPKKESKKSKEKKNKKKQIKNIRNENNSPSTSIMPQEPQSAQGLAPEPMESEAAVPSSVPSAEVAPGTDVAPAPSVPEAASSALEAVPTVPSAPEATSVPSTPAESGVVVPLPNAEAIPALPTEPIAPSAPVQSGASTN